ncbi:Sortilin-like [Oopsacas minuta]|uniref:Sortilin-like n=1 Tax=Oopsacas minuta TaxID=111878 RepID=A0AAV7KH68_9METZ|nr:Sortilin-like [Oopsacas minuta]
MNSIVKWVLFLFFFIFLLRNTNCTKNTIPLQLKDTVLSNLQESRDFPLNRHKRDHPCEQSQNSPAIELDINALDESKDHIRMQWLEGDNLIMIASDQSATSVTQNAHTSVWIIDATNSHSVLVHKQDEHIDNSIFTLVVNPLDKSNAVLIAYDLRTLYVLHGNTWTVKEFTSAISIDMRTLLSDETMKTILFHPTNPSYLMLPFGNQIFYSKDSGTEWSEGPSNIVRFQWGRDDTVYYTMKSATTYYEFYRTDDLFETHRLIQAHILKFYFETNILFISKQNEDDMTNKTRAIWVSTDFGDNFNFAHIPEVTPEQYYDIIAVTDSYVMLHLGNSSSVSGQLFISDSKFTSYSLSLNNHLSQSFYQVQSMRGVYIASIPVSPRKVQTLITYNAGAEWERIQYHDCPNNEPCYLNLYVSDVLNKHIQGIQSHSNAKGLLLGYGVVGEYLDITDTSTLKPYMSADGGYKWEKILSTGGQFVIGNYGNLLVGVKSSTLDENCFSITSLQFTHSQKNCWIEVNLEESKLEGFKYCGLNMEPGASSLKAFFWGVNGDSDNWSFLIVDFLDAFDRVCGKSDFEDFTPHAATGCLFGYNETFQRVKSDSFCYIGTNEAKLTEHGINRCVCREEFDFECDFGYERKPGPNTTCFPIPGYDLAQHCSPGEHTYSVNPLGLRIIAGDNCTGADSILKETKKFCSNWDGRIGYVFSFFNSHQTTSLIAGIIVLLLAVLCLFLAVFFIFRAWLRKKKSKEVIAYKSLLEAAEDAEDNSSCLGESDTERNDVQPLEF